MNASTRLPRPSPSPHPIPDPRRPEPLPDPRRPPEPGGPRPGPLPRPGPKGLVGLAVPALLLVAACGPALIARTGTVEARITGGSADFFEVGRLRVSFTIAWTGADNSQWTTSHVMEGMFHTNGPRLEFDSGDMSGRFDEHSVTITHGIRTGGIETQVAERYEK